MTDSPVNGDRADAVASTLDQLAGRLGRDQVFGPPVEQGGAVVVPVARVRAGGGSAPGRRGGAGTGVQARPVGAFSISPEGRVAWHPAVDVNRIVLGGQIVFGVVGLALALRRYGSRTRRG